MHLGKRGRRGISKWGIKEKKGGKEEKVGTHREKDATAAFATVSL